MVTWVARAVGVAIPVRAAFLLASLLAPWAASAGPAIHIEDVELFYRVYDAAGGKPSAEQLQRDYLDAGSPGLREFAKLRNITGARIADTLAKRPEMYSDAKRCMAVLPRVRARLDRALANLGQLYPEARFPPVTIAVGRGKPVGVGGPDIGVKIGLEALCATEYLHPDVEERFVHVISHEFVHVQQSAQLSEKQQPTVLELSLIEGAAEFTAELMLDKGTCLNFRPAGQRSVREVENAFAADLDKTDLSAWLNNGTPEAPGDLGYWVGCRIVAGHYQRAADKRAALREILQMNDAHAFLARSGWTPGSSAVADETADRKAVEAAAQSWVKAFNARDIASLAALVTDDIALMDPALAHVKGRRAAEAAWRQAFDMLGPDRVAVETQEAVVEGETAWRVAAVVRVSVGGDTTNRGQALEIWKRERGAWKLHRQMSTALLTPPRMLPLPEPEALQDR